MGIVRTRLKSMIAETLQSVMGNRDLKAEISIELEIPRSSGHGDYASNIAFALSKQLKRNPRQIASEIVANLNDSDCILEKTEIAGPGFINFFIKPAAWYGIIREILDNPQTYGRLEIQGGPKVQVEFVSANPTGPLHIGHGRGAAIGDVLANILQARGFQVQREYYINDAGNQMDTLGRSLYFRYRQELGDVVGASFIVGIAVRDLRELVLIDEVFRQRKPLLGICRGHQVLNVALGGTLVADILGQSPRAMNHRRMDQRSEIVHDVRLTSGSITGQDNGQAEAGCE